ncbi:hypothetical protein BZA77DRAFT_360721 [Pyronema omphalodes]|nr:hypothetical protein BZA77DRAFT_360721 [Pyronema omphalodes]
MNPLDLTWEPSTEFPDLERKYRNVIESLKARLDALTKENKRMKKELAKRSTVVAVTNMEILLRRFETRLNEKAKRTSIQQSNVILECIQKTHTDTRSQMQQHTKTIKDNIEYFKPQGNAAMEYVKAIHCMQILSDSRTPSYGYQRRLDQSKLSSSILEAFIDKMMKWGIGLSGSSLVYVEEREDDAMHMPFDPDEWSMRLEDICRIEISWIGPHEAYNVACFDYKFDDSESKVSQL